MFEIGKDVVCIQAFDAAPWMTCMRGAAVPQINRIYEVHDIAKSDISGRIGLDLVECRAPDCGCSPIGKRLWAATHFRPVRKIDLGELRSLETDPSSPRETPLPGPSEAPRTPVYSPEPVAWT